MLTSTLILAAIGLANVPSFAVIGAITLAILVADCRRRGGEPDDFTNP